MKKLKIFLIIILITLLLSGCSKPPENSNKANAETQENKENKKEETLISTENSDEEEPVNNEKSESNDISEGIPSEETTNSKEKNNKDISADVNKNDNESVAPSDSSKLDEKEVTIKIEGLAENKLSLTLDELKSMDNIIFEANYYWLNSFGSKGYTHFKGVNLWSLLNQKELISSDATKVSIIAQDGYQIDFTVEQVKKQDYMDETNPDKEFPMIIAWEENGEEYNSEKGAPFKLAVGQKEAGDVNKPQWVSNIDRIVIE